MGYRHGQNEIEGRLLSFLTLISFNETSLNTIRMVLELRRIFQIKMVFEHHGMETMKEEHYLKTYVDTIHKKMSVNLMKNIPPKSVCVNSSSSKGPKLSRSSFR